MTEVNHWCNEQYVLIKETDYPAEGIHPFLVAQMNSDETLYPEWEVYNTYEAALANCPNDCQGHTYYHIAKILTKIPSSEQNFELNEHDIEWDEKEADNLKATLYKKRFEEEVGDKLTGRDLMTIESLLKTGGKLSLAYKLRQSNE